LLATHCKI